MHRLNEERKRLGITIQEMAETLQVSYIFLSKVLNEEIQCTSLKEKIKFFLINNYTKCIENM